MAQKYRCPAKAAPLLCEEKRAESGPGREADEVNNHLILLASTNSFYSEG